MSIPEPAGHYSPFIRANGFLFTAGQLAIGPDETDASGMSAEDQTRAVLEKIEAILKTQGLDRTHVVKTTAFIADGSDWGKVNGIYKEFFGEHKPARSIVPVGPLHYGCRVEIEAIAAEPA